MEFVSKVSELTEGLVFVLGAVREGLRYESMQGVKTMQYVESR